MAVMQSKADAKQEAAKVRAHQHGSLRLGADEKEAMAYYTWMISRLQIVDKAAHVVPFDPKPQQMALFETVRLQAKANLPVRIIILKARQIGFSTATAALFFTELMNRTHCNAKVLTHHGDATQAIFDMTQRFHNSLPNNERLPTVRSNRKEIVFAEPHGGRIRVATAGQDVGDDVGTTGRAETNQYAHCSEVAFWPNAASTLGALLQTVPNEPGTMVILESTPNGMGDAFHSLWERAEKRMEADPHDLDGFIPLFFGWLDEPDYSKPLAKGQSLGTLDSEEVFLRELGATDAQLNWRRWKVANEFNGDPIRFAREYPATAEQGFQTSGRHVFVPAIIRHYSQMTCQPRWGRLEFDEQHVWPHGVKWVELQEPQEPCWHLWEMPEPSMDYTLGADVAEGALSDPHDSSSDPDSHAAIVLNRTPLAQVAEYLGQEDPDLFGIELVKAAYFFNLAWASPEVNAVGVTPLMAFKRANYSRIYRRQTLDERISVQDANDLGWKTTGANRNLMIDEWVSMVRPDPLDGYEGKIIIRSMRVVQEMRTFVADARGRREHMPGKHDDLLFAFFIAYQLHLRCPRTFPMGKPYRSRRRSQKYDGGTDQFSNANWEPEPFLAETT